MRKFGNILQIGDHARHERAGLVVIEERKRQLLQMVEHIPAHIRLHPHTDDMTVIGDDVIEKAFDEALAEIKKGTKTSDWIWYIFPQFRIFGHSETSLYYGISDSREAECYLAHPILGVRIREISKMLLKNKRKPSVQIFGDHGAKKVHSCMIMFDFLSPNDVFAQVLDAFYKGERGARTLKEMTIKN